MPISKVALDDRLAFVGTSGSGKTYAAGTAVEILLGGKSRIVIIDPLGVWWGLRLKADGSLPGFDVVIFGGERGDLPLNEHAGGLIGQTAATMAQSCIVDLSQFGTKAASRRFMLAFLTALYRHANREPLHLIFDEADMWAPQRLLDKDGDAAKLLGQMETIVRRGRVLGFIPWLITQRPAVLSKDVLSQADGIAVMKLTSSQDRDAIGDWVEGQADKAQWRSLWAVLPTYPVGKGLLWIPGRGVLEQVTFPAKATFDSSRAPKRGERRATMILGALDLPALRKQLAAVEAEAKANDPRALKARVAQLEAEARERRPAHPDVIAAAERAAYQRGSHDAGIAIRTAWAEFNPAMQRACKAIEALCDYATEIEREAPPRPVPSVPPRSPSPVKPKAPNGDATLAGPRQRILDSLASWRAMGHHEASNAQVAWLAGYSPSSTSYTNPRSALHTAGLIEYRRAGII